MKKAVIPALVVLVLAIVIAAGSVSFLGPCVHEDGSFGSCHWAGQALEGVGLLLAALAALALFLRDERRGLYIAMIPASLLGILIPGTLINLCMMDTMRCRALMKPAMTLLCALTLIAAAVGWLLARGRAGRE